VRGHPNKEIPKKYIDTKERHYMIYRKWDPIFKIKTLIRHKSYWKSILRCPWSEPLHTDKDGCPACWSEGNESWTKDIKVIEDQIEHMYGDKQYGA
tara:strand:- start:498 stop:785 length:288 start_codon:yes stop_codon:yes gene_type:complete